MVALERLLVVLPNLCFRNIFELSSEPLDITLMPVEHHVQPPSQALLPVRSIARHRRINVAGGRTLQMLRRQSTSPFLQGLNKLQEFIVAFVLVLKHSERCKRGAE